MLGQLTLNMQTTDFSSLVMPLYTRLSKGWGYRAFLHERFFLHTLWVNFSIQT